ncbi:protein SENSITIVE TO UV 2-like [Lolium rigidum]|uniref:protein SENSITIVE TO UV 2-like n=1 Tax=Lolium rigidum TaxID=89674 RepID=UPI001F5C28E6|nr:protein SENSITIVE TO UV 2-like [Lolium rigidum]
MADFDDDWFDDNAQLLDAICRDAEEASASRNPSATPAPAPRAAASGGGFSPPRELSQRPAAEEDSECQIIEAMGPATSSTGRARTVLPTAASQARAKSLPRGRQARAAESKSAEEIKMQRELERVLKQMNDMKNENTELKKGMKNKDLEIEAKEAEIHILKKANLKDICSTRMDIDHAPADEALQAGGSCRTSTRRADKLNGKNKDLCSSRDGLCFSERTSTSGAYLEENAHLELKSNKCTDNKTKGVQTDLPVNDEHLEHKKVPINNISSSLCAIWGRPANSMLGRSLISKILASCSEEMLTLLQSTRSPDKCENSSEGSSSMHNAISEVYDIIIKVNSDAVPVQTLLEALLNLCVVGNVVVVGRALRILYSILQNLLTHGVKSNQRNNVIIGTNVNSNMEMESTNRLLNAPGMKNLVRSEDGLRIGNMFLPSTFWPSFFTAVLQIALKYSEESIRVDALSIVILVVRTSDPKVEREKFGFTSVMESLHPLLQKENGLLVKKHSVHLLFLLLNCPTMLKLLCNRGTDGPEVMEAVGSENDRSQQAISAVLQDLSECLTCEATSSLELKLCRLVVNLLAYIASSGKLGYQVLLDSVTANGSSFLELIMEVLASQMEQEVDFSTEAHELLKERYLLMREALILLNRLASHAMFSKPTLEVLVGSGNQCASLTIDTANRLPQRSKYPLRHLTELNPQMANDLAELAQKFRSRVYGFLEEQQHSKADRSSSSGLAKSLRLPPRVPR